MNDLSFNQIPLFIPHSSTSTKVNKTGSWRFFHPKFDEKTAPAARPAPGPGYRPHRNADVMGIVEGCLANNFK
jgi:hypothetical protein